MEAHGRDREGLAPGTAQVLPGDKKTSRVCKHCLLEGRAVQKSLERRLKRKLELKVGNEVWRPE